MSSTQQLLLGEGAGSSAPVFIEDVFSCFLYTGNGGTQTITNGIDLSTKGGLVWLKSRQAVDHALFTTNQGAGTGFLSSDRTDGTFSDATALTSFNTTGFTLGAGASGWTNTSPQPYVSWTFRKQPKFFDVVTYTGNGTTNNIAHNLGSIPGCIMIKSTSTTGNWAVITRDGGGLMFYHYFSSSSNGLNLPAAGTGPYDSTAAINSTTFNAAQLQDTGGSTNQNGVTYVAYLFAHDAGGFGLAGTDNVISCGTFTSNGSGVASVTLGYEPQFLLCKVVSTSDAWQLWDNMRGMSQTSAAQLNANTDAAETARTSATPDLRPIVNATGFVHYWSPQATRTWMYIAIRRGPMKVPTVGTTVFNPYTATLSAGTVVNTGVNPDLLIGKYRDGADVPRWVDRLRGYATATGGTMPELRSNSTDAEATSTAWTFNWTNTGFTIGNALNGLNTIIYSLRRAPSFFDEVCYTGNNANRTLEHNLGVAPELMIVKKRSSGSTSNWCVYAASLANNDAYLFLNTTDAVDFASVLWNSTAPTSTVFSLGASTNINESGQTCVAWLFATCAGVSKVGSYTGNGTTQTINCGFTGGARFVLIRRTDTTGNWYAYDTARGMTVLTDPYWFFNSNAGEVATLGSVTTVATGFALNSAILAAINVSAGNYIFLAIA